MISTERGSWLRNMMTDFEELYRKFLDFNGIITDRYSVYLETEYARVQASETLKKYVLTAMHIYRKGDREGLKKFFEALPDDNNMMSPALFYFSDLLREISIFERKYNYRNTEIVTALCVGLYNQMEFYYNKNKASKYDHFPNYTEEPASELCKSIMMLIACEVKTVPCVKIDTDNFVVKKLIETQREKVA